MTSGEYGKQCEHCHEKGNSTFARLYYKQLDGKWVKLCSKCWDATERNENWRRMIGGKTQ